MEWLDVKRDGPVAVVVMDHASDNTFNGPFVEEIMAVLDELEKDADVRALVFTGGHEKYFSNGLNLEWLASQEKEEMIRFSIRFNSMLRRILVYPKPVVAAINGHAFAGGCFMACCMDFRFMRKDRGWICVPEVDIGLTLPPGTIAFMGTAMGKEVLNRLALTGKRLTGPEAEEIGIVHEVCEKQELLPRAVEFAKELALKKPENYAKVKAALKSDAAKIMEEKDPEHIREQIRMTLDKK